MPELPDVQIFKEYLDATSLHQRVTGIDVRRRRILGRLSPAVLQRRLQGKTLESTRRHGKYLFARTGRKGALVLHFGMTGRLEYCRSGESSPKHTAALFTFSNGAQLAYVSMRLLGSVGWTEDEDEFIRQKDLGPDALSRELDRGRFRELVGAKRGNIKSALMDQQTIAGLGNVYVDEILFQSKIHPKKAVSRIDPKMLGTIYRQMHRVLKSAIRSHAEPAHMPKTFLLPRRGRRGAKCPSCGSKIERTAIAGRTTYFCPRCQQP